MVKKINKFREKVLRWFIFSECFLGKKLNFNGVSVFDFFLGVIFLVDLLILLLKYMGCGFVERERG